MTTFKDDADFRVGIKIIRQKLKMKITQTELYDDTTKFKFQRYSKTNKIEVLSVNRINPKKSN